MQKDIIKNQKSILEGILQKKIMNSVEELQLNGITKRHPNETIPISYFQKRLWTSYLLDQKSTVYNIPSVWSIKGELNITLFRESFNRVIQKHEILRTRFIELNSKVIQEVLPTINFNIPFYDVSQFSGENVNSFLDNTINANLRKPFDLSNPPLIRCILFKLDNEEYEMFFDIHHIIFDGWSLGLLVKELKYIYTSLVQGDDAPLGTLAIQYADFSIWQQSKLKTEEYEKKIDYWKKKLDENLSPLNFPFDYPRTHEKYFNFNGAKESFSFSNHESVGIHELNKKNNTTSFMSILAIFKTLIYRYSSEEDIIVGIPVTNREQKDLDKLIGFFVNTLPIRTKIDGETAFSDYLKLVRNTCLDAYENQDIHFDKIVEEVNPPRSSSYSPIFQFMFAFQATPNSESPESSNIKVNVKSIDNGKSMYDLTLIISETNKRISATLEYNSELFERDSILNIITSFKLLLNDIIENPDEQIKNLKIEQNYLIEIEDDIDLNGYLDNAKCFNEIFEEKAKLLPQKVAVLYEGNSITYEQLNKKANQLANFLQKRGVQKEDLVGISMTNSIDLVTTILAIHKLGASYLPVDPDYPNKRKSYIVENSGISLIISVSILSHTFIFNNCELLNIDQYQSFIDIESDELKFNFNSIEDIAYVIYTSGSTGHPKGVIVTHKGIHNLISEQIRHFNVDTDSRVLQYASPSFDASFFEITMALGTGACLVIANKNEILPGAELVEFIEKRNISHVTLSPAILSVMPFQVINSLKVIISAGEECSISIIKKWGTLYSFYNAYGPTEATIWTTVKECKSDEEVTIGKCINNTRTYILDKNFKLVPKGVPGELFIESVGLAKGYLNNNKLTSEKFINNPINSGKGKLYRTGDKAKYTKDGEIIFLGRVDEQVKIRGFRVEIMEVENVIRKSKDISQVSVIIKGENYNEKKLVAFLVPSVHSFELTNLKSYLKSYLPNYMLPSEYVILDSLPTTKNGKVDKRALQLIEVSAVSGNQLEYDLPITITEKRLFEIWIDLLEIKKFGINDDFFEIGGHSLLATQLLTRIRSEFKIQLDYKVLFTNLTINSLAIEIDSRLKKIGKLNLLNSNTPFENEEIGVLMQKGDSSLTPLIFIHPLRGGLLCFSKLITNMDFKGDIFGLESVGYSTDRIPLTDVTEMAKVYTERILKFGNESKYKIIAYSFSGAIALEVVKNLERQGKEIDTLILLDSHNFTEEFKKEALISQIKFRKYQEELKSNNLSLDKIYKDITKLIGYNIPKNINSIERDLRVRIANLESIVNYKENSNKIKSDIVLFRIIDNLNSNELYEQWGKSTEGNYTEQFILGSHLDIVESPWVEGLAKKIVTFLD